MLKKLYIYIFLSSDGWMPCGLLEYEEQGRLSTSRFRYGKKYLGRKNRISIDPIQLPLQGETMESPPGFALFNGIRDAGPDRWGRYLLEKKFGGRTLSELEYIAATGHDRVGALAFSDSLGKEPKVYTPEGFRTQTVKRLDLAQCMEAVEDTNKSTETHVLKQYLQYGPSLGGARPKATVDWNGRPHVAKFSLSSDARNEPLLEYATMLLAKISDLNVPSILKKDVLGKSVYLIERFDRATSKDPIPFISGLTAMGLHEQDYSRWSYHLLVDAIIKLSMDPMADLRELFKRMIFNIMIYNNDDHPRNFGFLYAGNDRWKLSPLYDVVPSTVHTETFNLAMVVGVHGKEASISNALSLCERFRLSRSRAEAIVREMRESIANWRKLFKNCGIESSQISTLENSFSAKN